jgi:hypothetical protein
MGKRRREGVSLHRYSTPNSVHSTHTHTYNTHHIHMHGEGKLRVRKVSLSLYSFCLLNLFSSKNGPDSFVANSLDKLGRSCSNNFFFKYKVNLSHTYTVNEEASRLLSLIVVFFFFFSFGPALLCKSTSTHGTFEQKLRRRAPPPLKIYELHTALCLYLKCLQHSYVRTCIRFPHFMFN